MDKAPSPDNAIAITCGPPIMIKFVIQNLQKLGFGDEQIYTTIENKMKCGVGKCGRCNVGKDYVCVKGPVYCWAELKNSSAGILTTTAADISLARKQNERYRHALRREAAQVRRIPDLRGSRAGSQRP